MKALLLAAGLGKRLRPLTNNWPKCLMPIKGRPLLEYWLRILKKQDIENVLINRHHHSEIVKKFLQQPQYEEWVQSVYEEYLLGTAGTLRENADFFYGNTVMIAHADNWCCCDFPDFMDFHHTRRPKGTVITMMTFNCPVPSSSGIVEIDNKGIVIKSFEKVVNPPGKLANAAVYLVEPEVVEWLVENPHVTDFSTEVLPYFVGRIATWENRGIHRDIGTIEMLKKSQLDQCDPLPWPDHGLWQQKFSKHNIHDLIG